MRFSVLEMGELKDKPDLLAAVMFSMMIYVEQRMYLSDRQQHKVCLIDEAWKLLSKDNKRAEDFIENGYRTARKYNGAYITITRGLKTSTGRKPVARRKRPGRTPPSKSSCVRNRDAFRKYCTDNPEQFNRFEREVIEGFPAAREAHFSAFMLRYGGRHHSTACCSTLSVASCSHPTVRILTTAKPDSVPVKISTTSSENWPGVSSRRKWRH